MVVPRRRKADRANRPRMWSPGRPTVSRREHRKEILERDCKWPFERGGWPDCRRFAGSWLPVV